MSFRQDNLQRSKNIRFLFLLLMAGAVFYFFSGSILDKGFNVLSFITTPIWKMENLAENSIGSLGSLFISKQRLKSENERLVEELDNIKLRLNSLVLLEEENEELLMQMGRDLSESSKSIIAAILSGPNIPPYESLIIDAGRNQGVSVGDRVIYEPNIVLGEIVRVFDKSSKVKLYSAVGTITDVLIPTEEQLTHTIATGYGGGNFLVELPGGVLVDRGIQLLVPGSDMYILGVIDYIEVVPAISSQRIFVKYPVNIKNVRFVHIIKAFTNEYLE